jgi:hypothetical protein
LSAFGHAIGVIEAEIVEKGHWRTELIRGSNRTVDGHDLVSPTAAASTPATAAFFSARPCLIDIEVSAFQVLAVQTLDRGTGFISGGHFDESKTFGLTTVLVFDNRRRIHLAEGFKRLSQFILGNRKR